MFKCCQRAPSVGGKLGRGRVGQEEGLPFDFGGTGEGCVEMRQCLSRDPKSMGG